MPTFIKTGFWEKLSKAPKEYLNLDNLIQSIGGGGGTSYKKYVAILQNGSASSSPDVTVLENTLGYDINWTPLITGQRYEGVISSSDTFPEYKTVCFSEVNLDASTLERYSGLGWSNDTRVALYAIEANGDYATTFGTIYVEIRVYP